MNTPPFQALLSPTQIESAWVAPYLPEVTQALRAVIHSSVDALHLVHDMMMMQHRPVPLLGLEGIHYRLAVVVACWRLTSECMPDIQDYSLYATHPLTKAMSAFEDYLAQSQPGISPAYSETLRIKSWIEASYTLNGMKNYAVSPGIVSRLQHTEFRGLKTDDLQLPFPALHIRIPGKELNLTLDNSLSGAHTLDGVYIAEATYQSRRSWRFMLWGGSKNSNYFDDALYHFDVELYPDMSLDECVERNYQSVLQTTRSGSDALYFQNHFHDLFRLFLNIILYATGSDADLREEINPAHVKARDQLQKHAPGSLKHTRAKKDLKAAPEYRVIHIGRAVSMLPPETLATVRGPITVRTLVTGHYRNQVCGIGRQDRKRIWIQPFWRGSSEDPESNPIRVVG